MPLPTATDNEAPFVSLTFYPLFCQKCLGNWISKREHEKCIYCGSDRTINHNREMFKDYIKRTKKGD